MKASKLATAGLFGLGVLWAMASPAACGDQRTAAARYIDDFISGRLDTLGLYERGIRYTQYVSDLNVFEVVKDLSDSYFDRDDYIHHIAVRVSRDIEGRTITVLLPPKDARDHDGTVRPFGSRLGITDTERVGQAALDLIEDNLAFVQELYGMSLPPGDIEIVTLPLPAEEVFLTFPDRLASTYPCSRQIMFSSLDIDRVEGEGALAVELSHLLHAPADFNPEPFSWFSRAARRPAVLIPRRKGDPYRSPMLPYLIAVLYGPGAYKMDGVYEELDRQPAGFMSRETAQAIGGYIRDLREPMRHALRDYLERPHLWDTASWLAGMIDLCAFHYLGKEVHFDSTFRIEEKAVLDNAASVIRHELLSIVRERRHLDFEKEQLEFFHHAIQGQTFLRLVDRLKAETNEEGSPLNGEFPTEGRLLAAVAQGLSVISPDQLVSDLEIYEILELKRKIFAREGMIKNGGETGLSREQQRIVRDCVGRMIDLLDLEIGKLGSK